MRPVMPPEAVRVWGPGAWTVWSVGVVCGVIAALLAAFLVTWHAAPNCGHVATSANLRTGLSGFGIAALVLATPWMTALLLAPRRWKPMTIGLVVTALPLALIAGTHTHTADWNGGGFCS